MSPVFSLPPLTDNSIIKTVKRSKLRTWLLFAVLIPFALYSNLYIIKQETRKLDRLHRGGHFMDEPLYETRLGPAKEFFPSDAVVGYMTDESVDLGHKVTYLFLTQYALCPVLVVPGKDHPYVIGDYYGIDSPHTAATDDLTLIKDIGYGIRLYKGKSK